MPWPSNTLLTIVFDEDEDGDIATIFEHKHIHDPGVVIELAEGDLKTLEFVNASNVIIHLRMGQ